ncbi:calcium-binding protein, partial [Dapis sp. BLCC M126]|uniref:calcium-binding protein n=1 Tax=Dapis sp. BLCC M126 TaxID=3400189 RepID=UPI003CF63A99
IGSNFEGIEGIPGDGSLLGNFFNQIPGTEEDDNLTGTAENDFIVGNAGNDILTGDAGNDIIFGGDNKDILTGGSGRDRLRGGDGEDTFVFNTGSEVDLVTDFVVGEDTLQLSADFGVTAEQAFAQISTVALPTLPLIDGMDNRFLSTFNLGDDTLIIRHEGVLTSDSFKIV